MTSKRKTIRVTVPILRCFFHDIQTIPEKALRDIQVFSHIIQAPAACLLCFDQAFRAQILRRQHPASGSAAQAAKQLGLAAPGDVIVITGGVAGSATGNTSVLKFETIK